MNNWQDWVVGVLVVLCIARVIYGIFRFFFFVVREKIRILVIAV